MELIIGMYLRCNAGGSDFDTQFSVSVLRNATVWQHSTQPSLTVDEGRQAFGENIITRFTEWDEGESFKLKVTFIFIEPMRARFRKLDMAQMSQFIVSTWRCTKDV